MNQKADLPLAVAHDGDDAAQRDGVGDDDADDRLGAEQDHVFVEQDVREIEEIDARQADEQQGEAGASTVGHDCPRRGPPMARIALYENRKTLPVS